MAKKIQYRDFFTEAKAPTEPHCVMVNLPNGAERSSILNFISSIPEEHIYNDSTNDYGRETIPHITILYGILPQSEQKAKQILSKIPKGLSATLGKISKFANGDKPYDVLKIEVSSPTLTKLHNFLRKHCDNNWEWPSYNPHLTLAYVKKGTCDEYVGDSRFSGKSFVFDSFVYNNGVSGHKEPIVMKEYLVGQSGGYGLAAGGPVAPMNWAGTYSGPVQKTRLTTYQDNRRSSYMQGNTVVNNSLYDTIRPDDLVHPKFSPDEIEAGLKWEMRQMEYPDKDRAKPIVLQNLSKNPRYYSDLGMYNIDGK